MMWPLYFMVASVSAIQYLEPSAHQACYVNPLCTCTKAWPELGAVSCLDVPFFVLPASLGNSPMHSLNMERNGLRRIPEFSLSLANLWELKVSENELTYLEERALNGLEQRLRELNFSSNHLMNIPSEAIRNLEKMEVLDLSNNFISDIGERDIMGKYSKTLKKLYLSQNSLKMIRPNCFQHLEVLEELDLSSNLLYLLNAEFGPNNLRRLDLSDNQLPKIPFPAFYDLNSLEYLDLRENDIVNTYDLNTRKRFQLKELHLEHNNITMLNSNAFLNFREVQRLYLDGNRIREIDRQAFSNISLDEIYMRNCMINEISENAFMGLENILQSLDLSYNNLTEFPMEALERMVNLKELSFHGNRFMTFERDILTETRFMLEEFDVQGLREVHFSVDDVTKFQELKRFKLDGTQFSGFSENIFEMFGPQLERLSLINKHIKEIQDDAFEETPRLKYLDLSHNRIDFINRDAFKPIGHSLHTLKLQNALSGSRYPHDPLCSLVELRHLDLSNNRLSSVHQDAFSCMTELRILNLNHNQLNFFNMYHFRGTSNKNLEEIHLAFNKIDVIYTNTFHDMEKLRILDLSDNFIRLLEYKSFSKLEYLTDLNLEGNQLRELRNETFHNLPRLRDLSLAYNNLNNFDLNSFDQVGTLSTLYVDVQHNRINYLESSGQNNDFSHVSIKTLDFGHNNISYINASYFQPIKTSLLRLIMDHNELFSINSSMFYYLKNLQELDISYNELSHVIEPVFSGLNALQVLNMSYNNFTELPSRLFRENEHVRVVDFSYNNLEVLPADMFKRTKLQWLNVQDNEIVHFPDTALQTANNTLRHLNLSRNKMRSLIPQDFVHLFQLLRFDVSHNSIKVIQPMTLSPLQSLISLDLSHNEMLSVEPETLEELRQTLEELNLAATNFSYFPSLALPRLHHFNLSNNMITMVAPQATMNMPRLRLLDLSNNRLVAAPHSSWSSLSKLRWLSLSANPIAGYSNDTFMGLDRLEYLDVKFIPLQFLQRGVFRPLTSLRSLGTNTYPTLSAFNLPNMIRDNHALREIRLEVTESHLRDALDGYLPRNIREVTLQGAALESIDQYIFENLQSSEFTLRIIGTNLTSLPNELFANVGSPKNISFEAINTRLWTLPAVHGIYNYEEARPISMYEIDLEGNFLNCDCRLAWLDDWYMERYNEMAMSQSEDDRLMKRKINRHLRNVPCGNRYGQSLMDAMKNDIRYCQRSGRRGAGNMATGNFVVLGITLAMLSFFYSQH